MLPVDFPESNARYGPPSDLAESQCRTVPAYMGTVAGGSVDGEEVSVVAWKPSKDEISSILSGSAIFVSVLGQMPPHFLTTTFDEAIHPA